MYRHAFVLACLVIAIGAWRAPQAFAAQSGEALARGPIHEAYAEPIVFGENRYKIDRRPPNPIDEAPPPERPVGDNVVWIPGYWSFDDDRNDFVWVSGCWRAIPPDRSWIPGYWQEVERGGYVWTPGFWQSAEVEEIEYLPSPPPSREEGPIGQPPSNNYIWVPGVWQWRDEHYAWRRGFWMEARADWDWVPAHYVCAPEGCVYVSGYWDYPFDDRGMMFAPVYFPVDVYERPGFAYTPEIVLVTSLLTEVLFSFPGHYHYYFGDYYDPLYARRGIYPWYEVQRRHDWYDPVFAHRMWRHRDDRDWFGRLESTYQHRRDDRNARPANTYSALRDQLAKMPENERKNYDIAQPFNEVTAAPEASKRFEKLNDQQRKQHAERAKAVTQYSQQRSKWETPTAPRPAAASPPAATPSPSPTAPPAVMPSPTVPSVVTPTPRREAPSPSATPTPTTPTPAPRETPSPTVTPAPKATPAPSETPSPRVTPTPAPKETTPPKEARPEATPPAQTPAAPSEHGKARKVPIPTPPVSAKEEPAKTKEHAPPPKPTTPPPEASKAEAPKGAAAEPPKAPPKEAPPPDERKK